MSWLFHASLVSLNIACLNVEITVLVLLTKYSTDVHTKVSVYCFYNGWVQYIYFIKVLYISPEK